MRLATLNTWGLRGDWDSRLRIFQAGFTALDADIVVLQETMLTDQVDQALDMLGPGYHFAQQRSREADGQGITTASRWPLGSLSEVDLNLTGRTGDFACTCLVTEVLAPEPVGRVWVANHFPDYQLDHERERCRQAVVAARRLEALVADSPGHVIVAGDLDAESDADSIRFWTGRHVIDDMSVCYRSAWESTHHDERLATYIPENPMSVDADWPFRGIDHVLVRSDRSGPTLPIRECRRIFDHGCTSASDHYGLVVDFGLPPESGRALMGGTTS